MAEISSIQLPQGVAPLEPLLGTPARLRVARILSRLPEKEFTGRELARLCALSHSSVQDAMETYLDKGIVVRRVIGRSYVYKTNQKSFLFQALRELFRTEGALTEDVVERIRRRLAPKSLSCTIFGSSARGEADERSDLDILVVARNRDAAEEEVVRLRLALLERYGVRLDAKVLTPSELHEKGSTAYLRSAIAEGVRISGEPLTRVMGTG